MTDYRIIKFLGKGGYGQVHLVEHKPSQQQMAMKVQTFGDPKETTFPNKLEMWTREAHIEYMLDSRYAIKSFCMLERPEEDEEHRREHLIIMELMAGGDL